MNGKSAERHTKRFCYPVEWKIGVEIQLNPFPRVKRLGEEVGYLMIPLSNVGSITLMESNFCISVVKYFYATNDRFERKWNSLREPKKHMIGSAPGIKSFLILKR